MKTTRIKLIVYSTILACVFAGCLFCATTSASAEDDTTTCTAMNRLYNRFTGEHFYTASADERDSLIEKGWSDEGTGWIAPKTSNTPVYRLYNKYAGDHHYTLNAKERDNLVKVGWTDEGIGWYSDDNKEVALLRQYNPNAQVGTHNFTTSTDENASLVRSGWSAEGVSWYGINHEHTWKTVHKEATTTKEEVWLMETHDQCGLDDFHNDPLAERKITEDGLISNLSKAFNNHADAHIDAWSEAEKRGDKEAMKKDEYYDLVVTIPTLRWYKNAVSKPERDEVICSECSAVSDNSFSKTHQHTWKTVHHNAVMKETGSHDGTGKYYPWQRTSTPEYDETYCTECKVGKTTYELVYFGKTDKNHWPYLILEDS